MYSRVSFAHILFTPSRTHGTRSVRTTIAFISLENRIYLIKHVHVKSVRQRHPYLLLFVGWFCLYSICVCQFVCVCVLRVCAFVCLFVCWLVYLLAYMRLLAIAKIFLGRRRSSSLGPSWIWYIVVLANERAERWMLYMYRLLLLPMALFNLQTNF